MLRVVVVLALSVICVGHAAAASAAPGLDILMPLPKTAPATDKAVPAKPDHAAPPPAAAVPAPPPAKEAEAPAPAAPVYTVRVAFSVSGRVVNEVTATLSPGATVKVGSRRDVVVAADCKAKPGRKPAAPACNDGRATPQDLEASLTLDSAADPKLAATVTWSTAADAKAAVTALSGIPGIALLPAGASIIVTLDPPAGATQSGS